MICIIHTEVGDFATGPGCKPAHQFECQITGDPAIFSATKYAVCIDPKNKVVVYAGKIYPVQET